MVAAGNGHTPFMRFLLEEGADPQTASTSGEPKGRIAAGCGGLVRRNVERRESGALLQFL